MPKRTGYAELPLHYGKAPRWLFDLMKKLWLLVIGICLVVGIWSLGFVINGCAQQQEATTTTSTTSTTTTTLLPTYAAYISTNEGQSFSDPVPVYISNFSAKGLVDPCAVLLDDGRIRLYYFGSFTTEGDPVSNQPDGINRFFSAISEDGFYFSEEAQVISNVDVDKAAISDPFVLKNKAGIYIMYISYGTNVLSARSSDGLHFTWDSEKNRGTEGGVPGALLLSDGKIRLYYHNSNGIKSAKSLDNEGLNFTTEEGFRINPPAESYTMAGDPNPIQFTENKWLMCFKKSPGGGPQNDRIFIAQSTDEGYTWNEISSEPVVTGSVPTIVKDKNGRILLYAPAFWGNK